MPKRTGLSDKQKKALNAYLGGMSKTDAMLHAGYSESTAKTKHSDIFNAPEMVEELNRRQQIAATRADVSLDWIVDRLKSVADANLGDLLDIDEEGSATLNMSKMTPELKRALTGYTVEEYMEGRGPGAKKVKRHKVNLADKLRALELLVRHLGLSKEKVVVEVEGDLVERLQRGRQIAKVSDNSE